MSSHKFEVQVPANPFLPPRRFLCSFCSLSAQDTRCMLPAGWGPHRAMAARRGKACTYVFSNLYSNSWLIFCKSLRGSFSAVSKPNFARRYSFESSWWDLHCNKIDTRLHRSTFKISAKSRQTFSQFHSFILKIHRFFPKRCRKFKIHEFW